jgi:hypothetical protein
MKKIIAISGKKHSGKDTAARVIMETLGDVPMVRIAFADALKEEVAKVCGVTVDYIELNKDIFRPILQWWGTEWRRNMFGDNYWIDRLFDKVDVAPADVIVITDVRFKNEYDAIQSWQGTKMMLRIERAFTGGDMHSSETQLDGTPFDYRLTNATTLEEFEQHVARLANRVFTQRLGLPMRGEP